VAFAIRLWIVLGVAAILMVIEVALST